LTRFTAGQTPALAVISKDMGNPKSLLQILPILAISLCIVFFVIYKILARFKDKAQARIEGGAAAELRLAASQPQQPPDRIKLECPALIEKSQGVMKVGIKEIGFNGAFVSSPRPYPIGATFQIKIFAAKEKPLLLRAEVIWNNMNVPADRIVTRGMKVRFLGLSQNERQILQQLVSG